MAIFVRCIDNTLVADVLVVGEIYEVMHINERDGLYALSGLARFTMTRFKPFPLRRPATGHRGGGVRPPEKSLTRHSRRLCVICHSCSGELM
jgi:hypothetical protein